MEVILNLNHLAIWLLVTLTMTRLLAKHAIDQEVAYGLSHEHRPSCYNRYSDGSRYLICEDKNLRSRHGIVWAAFFISLGWPITGPLYLIFKWPTKQEKLVNQRKKLEALESENARLMKELEL